MSGKGDMEGIRPLARAWPPLDPEKVAYWYFRLNGYLSIENFVVHPERRGGQRTDADLLAVRFPYRAERLFDDPADIMEDDAAVLAFGNLTDVAIVEVKTNQPCTLNGPWTNRDRQNVERVLAAIGCIPPASVSGAAEAIYDSGAAHTNGIRIRLMAVGRERDVELSYRFPAVTQLTWPQLLSFIWRRFDRFSRQKTQVDQWDPQGRHLKAMATANDHDDFVAVALNAMGVAQQVPHLEGRYRDGAPDS